jgi:hypothetical protein
MQQDMKMSSMLMPPSATHHLLTANVTYSDEFAFRESFG